MSGLERLGRRPVTQVTEAQDASAPSNADTPELRAPDTVRQGAVPRRRWVPNLLRGAVITAAAAAMLVTALPVMRGAALPPDVGGVLDEKPVVQVEQPIRGVIHADLTGGRIEPLEGRTGFVINGEHVDRVFIHTFDDGGPPGQRLGEVDLSTATAYTRVETETGADGYAWLAEGVSLADATTTGLPRDVSGVVRRGAAPDAEPGSMADHLYLQLPEDGVVYLNGAAFRDTIHLGPEGSLPGLVPGAHAELGGRLHTVDTEHGPMAQLAAMAQLATAGMDGAPATPPTFDGTGFVGADGEPRPTITLLDQGGEQDVMVIDPEAGRAYRGALTEGAASFKGFYADVPLTTFLAGGPTLELLDGAPAFEGRPLQPLGDPVQDGPTSTDWYRDADTGAVFQVRSTPEKGPVALARFDAP